MKLEDNLIHYLGAAIVAFAEGVTVHPEIILPSVFTEREIQYIKPIIESTASSVFSEAGFNLSYRVGCIIDSPRACMRADFISKTGMDFLFFDFHYLTQLSFGCSKTEMDQFIVSINTLFIYKL
jgi:pyruvate,orthophosphate dikinase